MSQSPPGFTSQFDIPYSSASPLHTLDLHFSTSNPSTNQTSPKYLFIFIHGGAFRDPQITSRCILSSLPGLFALPDSSIIGVASLNYRLVAYPNHPTAPSDPSDESRNVVWPAPLDDIVQAIEWLASGPGRALWNKGGGDGSEEDGSSGGIILAGHSIGATLSLHAAARLVAQQRLDSATRVRAVVGVAGVYDFTTLRDAHLSARAVYDEIHTGAFGPETRESGGGDAGEWAGGWERGKVNGRTWKAEGVDVVVLGHGRADVLVDMGQAEGLIRELEDGGWGASKEPVARLVECEGDHADMVLDGKEIGRCVGVAISVLRGRNT